MIANIVNNTIIFENGNCLTAELFNFLTGKDIDFESRNGRKVEIKREGTHLILTDAEFVIGGRYRKNRKIFVCVEKVEKGALLVAIDNDAEEIEYSENIEDWETV